MKEAEITSAEAANEASKPDIPIFNESYQSFIVVESVVVDCMTLVVLQCLHEL